MASVPMVPTEPIREAIERERAAGTPLSEIARRAGYMQPGNRSQALVPERPRHRDRPDAGPLRRLMREPYVRATTAERVMRALNLDPVDLGL